jgi:hypothetical protein
MLNEIGPIQGRDLFPLYNEKLFNPSINNMISNSRKPMVGAGMDDLSGEGMDDLSGEGMRGAGPAPKVETFRKLASQVYKAEPTERYKDGLLLDPYTLRKSNGKPCVQFYVYTTPQPYELYASMPVYQVISKELDGIFGVGNLINKSFVADNLWL